MASMSLGRYVPSNTPIHKMDPRIKLVAMIVFMVAIFLDFGSIFTNYIYYGIFFFIFLAIMLVGKVSFKSIFKSLKAIWIMMLFLFLINVLMTRSGTPAFDINGFVIYYEGIYRTIYIIVRLLLMIMLTTVLTSTTKPLELTFALEWLLYPLNYIKIPVHVIAMTLSLALRFIPTLMEEAQKIMRAQASRGVDFKEGKLKEKFRAIISLIIPLFVSCFIRSGELADAMEARGYDPLAKRTKFERRLWNYKDTLGLILITLFLGGIIALSVLKIDLIALIQSLYA